MLYLASTPENALDYAYQAAANDEENGHTPQPIVLSVRLEDLKGLRRLPDDAAIRSGELPESAGWKDTLRAVGSMAVLGPVEKYKRLFHVAVDGRKVMGSGPNPLHPRSCKCDGCARERRNWGVVSLREQLPDARGHATFSVVLVQGFDLRIADGLELQLDLDAHEIDGLRVVGEGERYLLLNAHHVGAHGAAMAEQLDRKRKE